MRMKRNKPGPKQRDRLSLVVRLDRAVAEEYAKIAAEKGLSRNQVMEAWLSALVEVRSEIEEMMMAKGENPRPDLRVAVLGDLLVDEAVRLGAVGVDRGTLAFVRARRSSGEGAGS